MNQWRENIRVLGWRFILGALAYVGLYMVLGVAVWFWILCAWGVI
jgi:hypothetical protein